jgi:hypothetical protein
MRVSELTRPKIVEATFAFDSENVTFGLDRNRVTLAWASRVQQSQKEFDAIVLAEVLAEVVASWDITQDDGVAFPPTAENMAVLPTRFLLALSEAVGDAAVPSDAEGKASAERPATPSSGSEAPQPTSPNGHSTSLSPAPSASPSPT